jgi:L-fuculose-phosphate aldolase
MSHAVREARGEVVRVARQLRERGLAVGTSGNVGIRLDDGRIAITPSSMEYDELTVEDVVIVEADGSPSEGRRGPSSELPLHVGVFGARPDVRAIVHSHSPFATTFAIARREIPAVHYVMALLVAPGRDTLRVGADNACLLANHGAIAVGGSLASALGRAERVEELATLAWRAERLGGPVLLTAADLDAAREQIARFPRQTRETG